MTFQMTVPLPQPVDPQSQELAAEISDREYYVEVLLAQHQPVALENADGVPCSPTVRDNPANAYFDGYVIPQRVSLQCH